MTAFIPALRATLLIITLVLAAAFAGPASAEVFQDDPGVKATDGYRNYEQLTERLRHFASEHPELIRLESAGTSLEGREIWYLEIAAQDGTPVGERPALLVVGGLEGHQAVGSELSIMVAHHLIHESEADETVQQRLRDSVFYIFPRANPDAVEQMFATVRQGMGVNARPFDDDNDGRVDEDGPDDLNRDGMITVMRALDPEGEYMIDPDEPRLLRMADASKGETGTYAIYWEGVDDDGDGFYNEDAAGGVSLDRNFQHEYPYYQRGAGPHMVSEPETRALADFMIAHRNIAIVLEYGESDNLVTAPNSKGEVAPAKGISLYGFADASVTDASSVGVFAPPSRGFFFRGGGGQGAGAQGGRPSTGRRPATTINGDDLAYFTAVSKKYGELTGLKGVPATRKPEGALFQYGYFQYGVPSFSTPGWAPAVAGADSMEAEATPDAEGAAGLQRPGAGGGRQARGGLGSSGSPQAGGSGIDAALLKWMDDASIDGFADWSAYDHPTLGAVEIGGFRPFEAYNPPHAVVEELAAGQGAFVLYLASLFSRVRIADVSVTDHGGGVFRVAAEIENAGYLPTSTAHGVVSRSVKPTMVQLGIEPDALLSGSAKTSFFQATDGSGGRQSFEWIVRGGTGDEIDLRVVSQKGGADTRRVVLR